MRPNFHYKIRAYDTLLPQDDPNKSQRALELDYKRTLYKYSGKDKGLPGMIDKIPSEEEFPVEYFLVWTFFIDSSEHSWNLLLLVVLIFLLKNNFRKFWLENL